MRRPIQVWARLKCLKTPTQSLMEYMRNHCNHDRISSHRKGHVARRGGNMNHGGTPTLRFKTKRPTPAHSAVESCDWVLGVVRLVKSYAIRPWYRRTINHHTINHSTHHRRNYGTRATARTQDVSTNENRISRTTCSVMRVTIVGKGESNERNKRCTW